MRCWTRFRSVIWGAVTVALSEKTEQFPGRRPGFPAVDAVCANLSAKLATYRRSFRGLKFVANLSPSMLIPLGKDGEQLVSCLLCRKTGLSKTHRKNECQSRGYV